MSLVEHAERELNYAGLLDKDSDYDGMLGEAALELIKVFAKQGHSGYSAMATSDLFNELSHYRPLTPITSNPDEWMHISEDIAGQPDLWQSRRSPSLFSHDGGKTWYDVNDDR